MPTVGFKGGVAGRRDCGGEISGRAWEGDDERRFGGEDLAVPVSVTDQFVRIAFFFSIRALKAGGRGADSERWKRVRENAGKKWMGNEVRRESRGERESAREKGEQRAPVRKKRRRGLTRSKVVHRRCTPNRHSFFSSSTYMAFLLSRLSARRETPLPFFLDLLALNFLAETFRRT